MKEISFNQITNLFDDTNWDIGYLTTQDLQQLIAFPIKEHNIMDIKYQLLLEQFIKYQATGIIFVKQTNSYDYSMTPYINLQMQKIAGLTYTSQFIISYKTAMILAGLGQYGKNQIIYSYKFGFDIHIHLIVVLNPIKNLPIRNKPNWNFLPQCENCTDCFNACPVHAIHNQEKPYWIDDRACRNFCGYGNDLKIPSIKWAIGRQLGIADELLEPISNIEEAIKYLGTGLMDCVISENNQQYLLICDNCRECCSQPKCSKYNGQFPYRQRGSYNKILINKE